MDLREADSMGRVCISLSESWPHRKKLNILRYHFAYRVVSSGDPDLVPIRCLCQLYTWSWWHHAVAINPRHTLLNLLSGKTNRRWGAEKSLISNHIAVFIPFLLISNLSFNKPHWIAIPDLIGRKSPHGIVSRSGYLPFVVYICSDKSRVLTQQLFWMRNRPFEVYGLGLEPFSRSL